MEKHTLSDGNRKMAAFEGDMVSIVRASWNRSALPGFAPLIEPAASRKT